MNKQVAVTFDLDLTDYVGGGAVADEFSSCWPLFMEMCSALPELRTTWFIRIDEHMAEMHGNADYIFTAHPEKIKWLKDHGHQLAWHFHSFRKQGGKWKQNPDENDVAAEMKRVYPLVEEHGLTMLRMGWAYHTNTTMHMAASLGVSCDCTALPRPVYTWEKSLRDWSTTPFTTYRPSLADYRVPGQPDCGITELPITTAPIAAPYDTEPGVLRYINPAYHEDIFRRAIDSNSLPVINTLAHPYEFLPNNRNHGMLSFDHTVFQNNLSYLKDCGYQFMTMNDVLAQAENGAN